MSDFQIFASMLFICCFLLELFLFKHATKAVLYRAVSAGLAIHLILKLPESAKLGYFLILLSSITIFTMVVFHERPRNKEIVEVVSKKFMNQLYLSFFSLSLLLCLTEPLMMRSVGDFPLLSTDVLSAIVGGILIVLVLLGFGIPPLQQGEVDWKEAFPRPLSFDNTLIAKTMLLIGIMCLWSQASLVFSFGQVCMIVGLLVLFCGLSLLVAMSQMSVSRTLAYLEMILIPTFLVLPLIKYSSYSNIVWILYLVIIFEALIFPVLATFIPRAQRGAKLHWDDPVFEEGKFSTQIIAYLGNYAAFKSIIFIGLLWSVSSLILKLSLSLFAILCVGLSLSFRKRDLSRRRMV